MLRCKMILVPFPRLTSMKRLVCAVFGLVLVPALASAAEVSGVVTGYTELPATAKFTAPASAPAFKISGKFTGPAGSAPVTALGSLPGKSQGRLTGLSLPMLGQPRQGYSDIQAMPGNIAWALQDNGYGAKSNSADAMLVLTQFKLDWVNRRASSLKDILLSDPKKRMPYPIANSENNPKRYLSGADLDPESFRFVGSSLWIGDEFGPYLVKTDRWGRIEKVIDTFIDGERVCAPDNPSFKTCRHQIKSSKGFENMAVLPGDRSLIAMLEGPMESATVLKALEFDLRTEKWTGKSLDYPLDVATNSVGALTALDANHLLVIERDSREGTAEFACVSDDTSRCFKEPAQFKRLYKVSIDRTNGKLVKQDYIDLLKLKDPRKLSGSKQRNGIYAMPFWTIEAVTLAGKKEVLIVNDNNFPSSASREPNTQDANEFVRVDISSLL